MGSGEERRREKMQALDECREAGENEKQGGERKREGERITMREEKGGTDKKGEGQEGRRVTGRRRGGRGICIPTLYRDPCRRPRELLRGHPA